MKKGNTKLLILLASTLMVMSMLASCDAKKAGTDSSNLSSEALNSDGTDVIDMENDNESGVQGDSNGTQSNQGTNSNQTGGSGKTFPGKATNLNGRTIKFALSYLAPGTGDEQSKRATKLYSDIETKLNCKIVFDTKITYDQMSASIMSGSPKADIWMAANHTEYINQYIGKLIQPLNSLQVTDFTDTTKYSAAGQLGNINGTYYGVCPLTYGATGGSAWVYNVLFFNKSILQSAGYSADAMYELQTSGTWNWAKFEEIAKKVTQGTKYAINDSDLYFYNGLLASNSASWVTQKETGLTFTGADAKNQEVLTFYQKLVKNGQMKVEPSTTGYSLKDMKEFIAGNVAFYSHPVWAVQHRIKGANFDWGMIAMPKSPSAKDYVGDSSWASFYTIPRGVAKPNEPLTVIDEIMSNPLFKGAENDAQYVAFYSTFLKDAGSLKTINLLRTRERQSWQGATEAIKLTFGETYSWYPKVGEIANGASIATITGQVSQQYENLLKDLFTKK